MRKKLLLILLLAGAATSHAQTNLPCVDTTRVNPYYICGVPDYIPVCGCDGVTYRNDCSAYFMGGVNFSTAGCCGDYDFDILQDPVAFIATLSIYTRQSEPVLLQVYNIFGKIVYGFNFNSYQENVQQFFIDTGSWERGLYIVNIVVNGQTKIKKFVKANTL